MLHSHRRFAVTIGASLEELTKKLTEHTWPLCTCFAYQRFLLANDSFSEDGAQEYAVYREDRQIASLTVSWMTRVRLQEALEALVRGEYEPYMDPWRHSIRSQPASIAALSANEDLGMIRFALGRVVATPGALAALEKAEQQPAEFLDRHVNGDWGEISDEDREENEIAVQHGLRILSAYTTSSGDQLWVLTEADRSATIILLPSEY
jgi:hypothetical protein